MMEYLEFNLFNKSFYLGVQEGLVVWANWNKPYGALESECSLLLQVQDELSEYLEGNRKKFTFKMRTQGSDFQKKVWKELEKIPWGETVSYSEIATRLGSPQSVRAVASAIGKNPLAIFIACHRVISKNGGPGGFSGGLPTKVQLLKLEGFKF